MTKSTRYLTQGAIIAALYIVLTFIANALGLANGVIQVRFSEALTILPYFTPAAIPGLSIGCLLSNILTGCSIFDIVFGTLATLIGAIFTYLLRKYKFLAPIPPIVANVLIIPPVLKIAYGATDALPFLMFTVGLGEVISCGIFGMILLFALNKRRGAIFA